ncbi:MAG: metalloregulator ArsR/SmtB family transcription factor [Bacteroidales bacterium]|jgi:DNA-binding transcriptional ArsR family regulator|nr:metalloregulator ArsR/SmtB family transcription factor [Bacteroidales bacterium]
MKGKYSSLQNDLARFSKALSHPARVQIMEILLSQSCCYSGDMATEIPIARSTLSQHLTELKNAGLIDGEIELPRIRYCVNTENWEKARILFLSFFDKDISIIDDANSCRK